MKVRCPLCRNEYDIREATKELAVIEVIKMQADFGQHGRLVFEYAELFDTTRPLKVAKLLRILMEVREIWQSGRFALQKRVYTISREGMVAALKTVCNKNLTGLDNHNYLKKVMVTIAEAEAQKTSIEAEKRLRQKEAGLRSTGLRPDETVRLKTDIAAPMPAALKQTMERLAAKKKQENLPPVCLNNCLYHAPLSSEEGKVWCAKKGAYVVQGNECADYKKRNGG